MAELDRYDEAVTGEIAARAGVPRVHAFDVVASTMDVAHELAAGGAAEGTIVVADAQLAGRGRGRSEWRSTAGAGLWMTMIVRPTDAAVLEILSLRIGIAAALVLDAFAEERVGLKWPNDLYVGGAKLGGILVEARWRLDSLEWVAIGIGVNVEAAGLPGAASLRLGVRRADTLVAVGRACYGALRMPAALQASELEEFARRDVARGRNCTAPAAGEVRGIAPDGALLIESNGVVQSFRTGSLVFSPRASDSAVHAVTNR